MSSALGIDARRAGNAFFQKRPVLTLSDKMGIYILSERNAVDKLECQIYRKISHFPVDNMGVFSYIH